MILESFIGVLIIAALCFVLILNFIYKSRNLIVKIASVVVVVVSFYAVAYIIHTIIYDYNHPQKVCVQQLDTHTKLGNPYVFDTIGYGVEDGRYVGLYLSKNEMLEAWNKRSDKKLTKESDDGYYSLVRYLTSKDLRKDADRKSVV